MKKPFVSFGSRLPLPKFILAAALIFAAALLFFLPEESVPVFSQDGERATKSLFDLIKGA